MKILILIILAFLTLPIPVESAVSMADKLKGKILLAVEDVGQAWYVDPVNKERAFLGRPADAFRIMRELGLGISEYDYHLFNGYAPSRLSGRILLRVEQSGEAYYVFPDNLKMYYLGRPADAFRIMRELGLGIKNEDLNKIPIWQKYKEHNTQDRVEISKQRSVLPESGNAINSVRIARIGVNMPIIVSDSSEYGLSKGSWLVPNTSTPDQGGNTVLTGHRWKYLPPSSQTFYLLDKIEAGDIVSVIWEGQEYYYRVRETKVVDKTAVDIQYSTGEPILTLYTCHPIYSTANRLVVVADLITE
jgi:LPXTG-site transpeptidase (sortase) family protein